MPTNIPPELKEVFDDWQPIPSTGNTYFASKEGIILGKSGTKLKGSLNKKGYLAVSIHYDGKQYCRRVHRLVAEAFLPNVVKQCICTLAMH